MRKISYALAILLALGVCFAMTVFSMDADQYMFLYNLVVLIVMFLIILFAWVFGFYRMNEIAKGLEHATKKLGSQENITESDDHIFEVDYLDKKYQEYLAYLRKTKVPCDVGDYIGEYEINNYTNRHIVESVPDLLTSMGILGTFVGLMWGLRGFDPGSYETMASSITSLVDGIKVAFVTSIYGIALSMALSYWMRGLMNRVSEGLDAFQDQYYLHAVTPNDVSSVTELLSNQQKQTKVMQTMSEDMAKQIAQGLETHVGGAMDRMNDTMDNFTNVITLNQEELMQNISKQVMESMKKEFLQEFLEMRSILQDTNQMQKEYVQFMSDSQARFQRDFLKGERDMTGAMKSAGISQKECMDALAEQQEHLREFVDYMTQVMEHMLKMNRSAVKTLELANDQLDRASTATENTQLKQLIDRVDRITEVLERQQQKTEKKGLFR